MFGGRDCNRAQPLPFRSQDARQTVRVSGCETKWKKFFKKSFNSRVEYDVHCLINFGHTGGCDRHKTEKNLEADYF